jgi:hypothetical protein
VSALGRHRRHEESKADRLIREGRCRCITEIPGALWVGVVIGDTGRHLVTEVADDLIMALRLGTGSVPARSSCTGCEGFAAEGVCSHTHAAFRLRLACTPADVLFAEASA